MKSTNLCLMCLLVATLLFPHRGWTQYDETKRQYTAPSDSVSWRKMTRSEKIAATTIPVEQLSGLSTCALIDACKKHPFAMSFPASDVPARGFDATIAIANCMRELEARSDAGIELVKLYKSINPASAAAISSPRERVQFLLELSFVELMLARPLVRAQLSPDDQENLLHYCMSIYDLRTNGAFMGHDTSNLLVARLLWDVGVIVETEKGQSLSESFWKFMEGEGPGSVEIEDAVRGRIELYKSQAPKSWR